jgi:hypothetical protein
VLNARAESHASRLGDLPQRRDQGDASSTAPAERSILGNGVHDHELGAVRVAECECLLECGAARV